MSGERAFEPGGPGHGGEAAGHGASGAEAEHAGVWIRVLGADLPESSGGPLPEVLDRSLAFLVGLRAADREPSRSIRPEFDISPFEHGRFGGFRPSGGTARGAAAVARIAASASAVSAVA